MVNHARLLRIDWLGAWHHVNLAWQQRRVIFADDEEHLYFLKLLGPVSDRFRRQVIQRILSIAIAKI